MPSIVSPAAVLGTVLSLVALVGSAGPVVAQEAPPDPAPKVVQVDGKIRFSVDDAAGMPLEEFIRLAEKIIDRTIIYSPADVTAPKASIHLQGVVEMDRGPDPFYQFFQRLLYIQGFACVESSVGDERIVELINMQGQRRNEIGAGASFVPVDEVAAYRDRPGTQIQTVVTLEHINAHNAATATRPFFAQNATPAGGLLVGNLGDARSILLQGFGPQVWGAVQLLKLADVPPAAMERVVRVARLEHASAVELQATVEAMLEHENRVAQSRAQQGAQPDDGGPLAVIAHASLNALVLNGHPRDVERAYDLAVQLDGPSAAAAGMDAIVALRHAQADDVATTLRALFAGGADSPARPGAAGQPGLAPPTLSVSVDARSNSLLLRGDRGLVGRAKQIAERIDAAPKDAGSVARVTIDGERIGFAIPDGAELPMLEMIEIAQQVTGKVLTFRRSEVVGRELAISLVGTVDTTRDGFFDFFRTMLATRGLVVEPVEADGLELFHVRVRPD